MRSSGDSAANPIREAPGTLYVVATPIGNLGDMSPRAVQTLRDVSLIAAEDTRHSRRLLTHFGIKTPLLSYHQHNQRSRRDKLLAALAEGDIALISDAGTPAISDPGADLVAAALAADYRVSAVPGPSAIAAAMSVSGLGEGPFVNLGFLPRTGQERRVMLSRAAATGFPLVVLESGQRFRQTLEDLIAVIGDRPAVMARELTKLHEEIRLGSLRNFHAATLHQPPRGEIVLVIDGQGPCPAADSEVNELLRMLRNSGLSASQTAREAAAITGRSRSELYQLATALEREGSAGLEGKLAAANEDALQDALGDEERPQR
jgi:16S rRNA (cytidine1402-2'-O)-methyltransferase